MKILNTFVVKIASRCNINCTYCYMYNHADQSYKTQPKFISDETINSLVLKISNHISKAKVDDIFIVFHGGEPLLVGVEKFRKIFESLKSMENVKTKIHFAVQSNAILINKKFCSLFNEFGVGVGISLDGIEEINDQFRVDKKGKGTYQNVKKGLVKAQKYLNNGLGCLSVLNLSSSPIDTYLHYKSLNFKTLDYLLLDENYDSLHQIQDAILNHRNATWLIELFDFWYFEKDTTRLNLRKFEAVIQQFLGNSVQLDGMGTSKNAIVVIETNGDIEPVDVLKICGESFTKIKLNINVNELDEAFENDLIDVYYNSSALLPKKCLACPIHEVCGGGYLPHRYSSKNGFNNPSIYCEDLMKLIVHIQNTVLDSIPESLREEVGIEKLSFEKVIAIIDEKLPSIPEPDYSKLLESFKKSDYASF